MTPPTVSLKRLVDPSRAITYGIVQAGPDTPGGVPYIRPVDMTECSGITDIGKLQRTTGEIATVYRRSSVQKDDVVISIGPSYGKVMVIPETLAGANLTQGTARVAPASHASSRYLYWSLQTASVKQYWGASVGGATFRALNLEPLGRTPVPLHRLSEQRRIADFLDAETAHIDRIVHATALQVDVLKGRIIELFRIMTTTGGTSDSIETGIPWMPSVACDWQMAKVGHAFLTGSGTTPRASDPQYFGGDRFWVNTGDLRDSHITHPRKTVTDKALADYPTLRVYAPGSLVVAMYGATTGRVGILDVPACVNQACCVLTESGPTSSDYAYFWFRAHRNEILKLASGGGQPNISQDLVRSLRIPTPSREEQSAIVRRCRTAENSVSQQQGLLRQRGALLIERRQALITAAVTGQFDVSSASGRGVMEGVPSV